MSRVRISTTVDAERWAALQRLLSGRTSDLIDAAIVALVDKLEDQRELVALAAFPYEEDDDLAWVAPAGAALPYDGPIPPDVVALAVERRRMSQPEGQAQ